LSSPSRQHNFAVRVSHRFVVTVAEFGRSRRTAMRSTRACGKRRGFGSGVSRAPQGSDHSHVKIREFNVKFQIACLGCPILPKMEKKMGYNDQQSVRTLVQLCRARRLRDSSACCTRGFVEFKSSRRVWALPPSLGAPAEFGMANKSTIT